MSIEAASNNHPSASSEFSFKKLLQLTKPESKTLWIATFFLAVASAAGLAYPQFIRQMVDRALESKNIVLVDQAAAIIVIVFVIQAIAGSLRYYLFTMAGERIVLRLRKDLYAKILDQEIAFFDSSRTGELLSRISNDCTILQNAVSVNISMGLRNLAGALGGLVLMIYTSPVLALSMLLVIPPVGIGAVIFGKRIRVLSRKTQDAMADASIVAEETIAGIRTVRSFAQEPYEVARYQSKLQSTLELVRSKVSEISVFMTIATVIGYSAIAGVIWYGGRQVAMDQISIGDLTQFLIYLLMVAFCVGALAGLWGDFQSAVGATKRVFQILERQPLLPPRGGDKSNHLIGKLEFSHVGFHYPSRPDMNVLADFTLTIEPGQIVALVGASGSGKTTIANLLSGFYRPTEGKIYVDGKNLNNFDPEWWRKNLGLVAQEPVLISSSIRENILYGRSSATLPEVELAAEQSNCTEFISRFPEKMETLVGERGIQLSGGQKQRVAIARAILKNPRVLILDEATSALDAESEGQVQEALGRLMKGRTTLVIAHRLATIQNADLICVMDKGRIVELGKHSELIEHGNGAYKRLVQKQISERKT